MSFLNQGFGQVAHIAILRIEATTEVGKTGPTKNPAIRALVAPGLAKVCPEPPSDIGEINQRYQCHQALPRNRLVDDRIEACFHETDYQNLFQKTILHVLIPKWKQAIRLTTHHAMGSSDSS